MPSNLTSAAKATGGRTGAMAVDPTTIQPETFDVLLKHFVATKQPRWRPVTVRPPRRARRYAVATFAW